jgi:4-amino-4-deoxy-L-arabinose transferase-like glycosyltransferase
MTDFRIRDTSHVAFYASRLVVLVALAWSAVYVIVAATRAVYPYDLDFLEDSVLMQSLRIADGQPVYLPPNADFVPHVYMPLYTWLGGLLFKLTGPSFLPLRLLSFAATLTTAALVFLIARRESGRKWLAIACAGLWLGGYRIMDGWYELARVDSLFVMLSLAGFALGVYAGFSLGRLIVAAIVMALAFLSKQTGLLFAAGLAGFLLLTLGRRAWLFVLVYGALAATSVALLMASSGGWFGYYTFRIASANPIELERIISYVRFELFGLMAGLSLMAVGGAILAARRARLSVFREWPWLIGMGLAIVISGIGRASVGGAMNNLMPAYAFLCLAPAVFIREWPARRGSKTSEVSANHLRGAAERAQTSEVLARPTTQGQVVQVLVAAAILAQFALGVYNPLRFIPTAGMRAAGDRLVARVAAIDGPVYVMMHPYYALLAGKQAAAQIAVVWHARERGQQPLPEDLVRRIEDQYYAAIVYDDTLFERDPPLAALLEANYVRSQALSTADAPSTLTGMFAQPTEILVPRR